MVVRDPARDWILPQGNGRWRVWRGQENLGSYHAPAAALDDLAYNHWGCSIDTSAIGLPKELGGWNRLLPDTRVLFRPPAGATDYIRPL
jgi:hypothetical protein